MQLDWVGIREPEGGSHDTDLARVEEGDQAGDDAGIDDALDLLVRPISQVGQSPASVGQDLPKKICTNLPPNKQAQQDKRGHELDKPRGLGAVSVEPGRAGTA